MCRRILLSIWSLCAAFGAYLLRTPDFSLTEGFDSILLWALLGAALLISALLLIPEKGGTKLFECHPSLIAFALQGSGALLISISAAWQLYHLYPALRSFTALTAAALLLGGFGLFGGMYACGKKSKLSAALLLPLCASLLQLLSAYWQCATDPDLRAHDMRILFLCAAAFSVALLNDFAFFRGKRRLTLLFLSLTVTLAGAALPTTESLPGALSVAGTALAALGFLLALLFGFETQCKPKYELVDDPFNTGRVRKAPPESTVESPSTPPAASAPTSPAKDDDDFDLARVDRLLMELDLDGKNKQKR